MKLQDQVSNSNLSNKLKDLEVVKPSLFFRDYRGSKDSEVEAFGKGESYFSPDNVNCYTVAELEEMLPMEYQVIKNDKESYLGCEVVGRVGWYEFNIIMSEGILDKTKANALAKMLIYLLKNKLITS